jgi:acyl-CoA reductase-like NAD-dependent aldehyde dehydrogenase
MTTTLTLHIDGESGPARSGRTLDTVNPATGQVWATLPDADQGDVDRAVTAARAAFERWSEAAPSERGRALQRLAGLVADHAEELAGLESTENGRLIAETRAQMAITPHWLEYYGGLADKIEGAMIPLGRLDAFAYTRREPLGVVGVITPWNSPVWLTVVSAAPALAVGNTVVVKPSEFASASVSRLAELAAKAGLPPGVFNVVTGRGETGAALVDHPKVAKIAFTGGTQTGAAIAERLAQRMARFTLELGGKSPNVVFADADLDAAERGVTAGIFGNAGQACVAGSRLLVEAPIYDEFVERIVRRSADLRIGDPFGDETEVGPIATEPHLHRIESLVDAASGRGARIVAGGGRATVDDLPNGFFYRPTVVSDVPVADPIVQDEIFGPVLVPLRFEREDDAVELANATAYGLAAGVWTTRLDRAHRMARRIEAGFVWLNTYKAISYLTPFGGYKSSGVGRLHGQEAIGEFLQTKTVWHEPPTT